MVKRIGSLVTLLVLVLTECFTPMCCVLAENNAKPDFEVEENTIHEEEEESENQEEENMEDSSSNSEEEAQSDDNEKESLQESSDDILEGQEDTEDEEQDAQKSPDLQDSNIKTEGENEESPAGMEDNEDNEDNNIQNPSTQTTEIQTGSEANTGSDSSNQQENTQKNVEDNTQDSGVEDPKIQTGSDVDTGVDTSNGQENNQNNGENNTQDNGEQNSQNTSTQTPEIQTGSEVNTGSDSLNLQDKKDEEENEEGKVETITEEIQEIVTKIRYFFKKGGDSRYIKYGRDSNNIGTITLKDPKNGASITIMDKNLGANSVGGNGYYYQWGNNSGVKTVNSSNKTTEKAVYKDSYYSRGYDGGGKFIIGGTDYWENGAHYNNLWGNESKESSRYGACPVGYHIPTVKEWNQLLSIWGKIHTQDTSTSEIVLRYSANYATKNIHTFKGAATQCSQGDTECVDEDKLSIIIDTLSDELKLPLAGSYDENGNFHDGLGVYWTSISKDGNKAGVFDMNAYIGNGEDDTLMYKAQGHNIRCFQNIQPYEAPIAIEIQEEEELEAQNETEIGTGSKENPLEEASQENKEGLENQKQDSYSGQTIPSEFISYSLVLDTAKDLIDVEMNANGGRFSDNEETKVLKYGYYNQETTIDIKALKQDEYRSGYDIESEIEKISPSPVGYKLMDKVEAPEKEGYIFDGWYTELEGGEKVDLENLLVSEGMKVYAHWTAKEYTITRKNEDGTIKDTTKVAYGQIPTHEDITQPSDSKYTYTFKGWEPGIKEVTGDAEYKATYTYTLRKYTITWENEDGKVLKMQQIEYGTMPTYNGEIPTKESTEDFEYTFAGWDKEISEVKGNAKYIAKYDAKEIIKEDISTLSHDDENILSGTIEKGSEGSNDLGRGGNIQDYLPDSLELETGDVESGSALDLLEESLAQTEAGEILEYTQEDREMELAQIWETLNKQAIEGKKASHHVIVKVSAPVGAFPEGTELRITPIESLKMMQEIKDQLVENTDVTEESELVSFDISFVYTLSGGEVVELQPAEGKTVKVSFNYTYNDTLSQADSDSDKELKVYHLEEVKDEKGKKTDEVEVKEIEINNEESSDGELVVDAEKFSIYTLAAADGSVLRATQSNQLDGWGYGVITITGDDNTCIHIMDRNLGASEAGTGVNSYGYYYQWGNNYGFIPNNFETDNNKVNVSSYPYSSNIFITRQAWMQTLIRDIWGGGNDKIGNGNSAYDKIRNSYARTVTNFNERQGPCPSGWHVPSQGEWSRLLYYWAVLRKFSDKIVPYASSTYYFNSSNQTDAFLGELKIPEAGYLKAQNGNETDKGSYVYLQTSMPLANSNQYVIVFKTTANSLGVRQYQLNAGDGAPIRCFANTYSCDDVPDPIEPEINTGCNLPRGGTIEHGQSVTGYQTATVPYGQSCVGVQATCNNGNWSVENFTGTYLYSGCSVAEPATCSFQGQTIAHNGNLIVYSSASPTCPTECTAGTVTCNNGIVSGNTGYTNLSCTTVSEPCDGFTLTTTGAHGTYSACTPYTSNGTSCTPGATKYKLDSCETGYHNNNGTCEINQYVVDIVSSNTNSGTVSPISITVPYGTVVGTLSGNPITIGGNQITATPKTDTTQWDYEFVDWTNNCGNEVTGTCTITANFSSTIRKYNVTINATPSGYGSVNNSSISSVNYGTAITENGNQVTIGGTTVTATPTTDTDEWDYGFVDWTNTCGNVLSGDCTITANFTRTKKTYTVTWKNSNGVTLEIDNNVVYGTTPTYNGVTPTSGGNAQYSYTFKGWTPTISSVTGDITYTATYTQNVNRYTVTWKNSNGVTLETDNNVEYGTTPTYNGSTPTSGGNAQYSYTFKGWTPTISSVTGDITYTATYTQNVNRYTVTWKNSNGVTLETDNNVEYGTTPTYNGSTPTKPRTAQYTYIFDKWTPTIASVTGNITYTATYKSTINEYRVNVVSNNTNSGTVDKSSVTVPYGTGITINGNKVTIGSTTVTATPKTDTAQWDYEFVNWTNTCGNSVSTGCTITANFKSTLRSYTVTWKNEDGTTLETDNNVVYGTTPTYDGATPTKAKTDEFTYTFAGWSPEFSPVTGNITYTATYTSTTNKYLITFKNRDGTELQSSEVAYGTMPTAPANPSRAADNTYTYTFKSWTPSIRAVDGAQVYTATYNPHYIDYTITWKDYNGTQLSGATYHYNDDLVVLADPSKAADNTYTYEFAGWTPSLQNKVTGNKTYTATYTPKYIDYTITFVNWNNSEISSRTYHYGDTVTVPADPTKPANEQHTYRFTGWIPEVSNVTKSQVYTATYSSTVNQYTATIEVNPAGYGSVTSGAVKKDWGTDISVEGNTLTIGTTTITAAPTSRSDEFTYTFSGWTNNCGAKLTGDCTITANFKRTTNEYLITFKNRDGTELQSSEFEYGTTPSYTGTPTRPADEQYSYSFSGWSPAIYPVNGVQVYTAVYTNKINKYDVIFDSDGGDYTPDTQSIEYGSTAVKPTPNPTKTGYEFIGWTLNGENFNFSTPITGITNLVAKWDLIEYTITYNLDGGTNSDNNPDVYTVESGTITLQQPTKTGYTFLGWTGSNGDIPQTGVVIPTGSYGDKEYNAVWQANTNTYTVYHYVKKVGENTYALSKTDILTGTTDEILILSSLAKESEFICAHYSSGSLTGTENGPGEIITETTIKGDGSTKIYLYYTRNSYTVTLSGDEHVQMLKINGTETNQATLECGSEVPVEAVPKPGYHFVRWDREEKEEEEKEYGDEGPP